MKISEICAYFSRWEILWNIKEYLNGNFGVSYTQSKWRVWKIFTGGSAVGLDTMLTQGVKAVPFASRTLNLDKNNYTITERECLPVFWALEKFHSHLNKLPLMSIVDHRVFEHIITSVNNLSARMIRWFLQIHEFNIKIQQRPWSTNTLADCLSRTSKPEVKNQVEEIKRNFYFLGGYI